MVNVIVVEFMNEYFVVVFVVVILWVINFVGVKDELCVWWFKVIVIEEGG